MTSPEFGAERRRARKADLENCPFIPLERLKPTQTETLARLSEGLTSGKPRWDEIDAFFARLYGLKDHDLQVIRDTLAVASPYDTARTRACSPPTTKDRQAFVASVTETLAPFMLDGRQLSVGLIQRPTTTPSAAPPFEMLVMTKGKPILADVVADGLLDNILALAEETGTTQVIVPDKGSLVVGIYRQYRYWTRSRARLLCGDIIREWLDAITD